MRYYVAACGSFWCFGCARVSSLARGNPGAPPQLELPAGNRHREFFALDVTGQKGAAEIEVRGLAGNLADGVRNRDLQL